MKVSMYEFILEEVKSNKKISALRRFLIPIFSKKKEKLENVTKKNAFLFSVKNLAEEYKEKNNQKLSILVGENAQHSCNINEHEILPIMKGRSVDAYMVTPKSSVITTLVKADFKKVFSQPKSRLIYYQIKSKKSCKTPMKCSKLIVAQKNSQISKPKRSSLSVEITIRKEELKAESNKLNNFKSKMYSEVLKKFRVKY